MMDWETTWQGHEGAYYSINDILTIENNSSKSIKSAGLSLNSYDTESQLPSKSMFIGMPNPLIDSKRPFMYTLQNAFDGKKNTSFVENTENNLFDVIIFYDSIVKKIAIINGYASDKITYNNNNRIKTVSRTIYDHDVKNIIEKIKIYINHSTVRPVIINHYTYKMTIPSTNFLVINYFINNIFFRKIYLNALWCFMSIKYDVRI